MAGSLKGKNIVITRSKNQAVGFARALRQAGARIVVCPTIKIVPPKSHAPLDRAIRNIQSYDWLIFTSANGAEYFIRRFRKLKGNLLTLKQIPTCAIGPATAEAMRKAGIPVTKIAREYVAESILKTLPKVRGLNILIPRAKEAREILPLVLKKMGARVSAVAVYETLLLKTGAAQLRPDLEANRIDCVTFTSSSTVKGFFGMLGSRAKEILKKSKTISASIGPITSQTLIDFDWKPKIISQKSTTAHLARAVIKYYAKGLS